jgi:hypothetical protein
VGDDGWVTCSPNPMGTRAPIVNHGRNRFLSVLRAYGVKHLGTDLAGIYLIGSLAHGGYRARYSDIAVALITEQPLSEVEGVQVRAGEHSCRPPVAFLDGPVLC